MKNFLFGVIATVLFIVASGATYQDTRPKNYEYQRTNRLESVQSLGSQGWRLSAIYNNHGTTGIYTQYVLEREKR